MSRYEEFIGKNFGKLTVVKCIGKSQFNSPLFECKCECGNTSYATSTQLRNGQKKSCGCLKKEYHFEYKQKIADLEAKLAESEERLKDIDNWKENYGYSNYEDVYMLEDLQSRAFQSEDDTKVVDEILDYLNISDENEILSTIKQQLAEKEKAFNWLHEKYAKGLNQKAIEQLEKVKNAFNLIIAHNPRLNKVEITNEYIYFIDQQIKELKEGK